MTTVVKVLWIFSYKENAPLNIRFLSNIWGALQYFRILSHSFRYVSYAFSRAWIACSAGIFASAAAHLLQSIFPLPLKISLLLASLQGLRNIGTLQSSHRWCCSCSPCPFSPLWSFIFLSLGDFIISLPYKFVLFYPISDLLISIYFAKNVLHSYVNYMLIFT